MSNRRPKKGNEYNKNSSITKTKISKEINNDEDINGFDEYEDGNLNDIINAFEYFDINHDGKIPISELVKILTSFGNVMTEEEINKIFLSAGIDQTNNKEINYIQFINFWVGNK